MFVCVRACSYYMQYSECKFMYGNLKKRKGILGAPASIILAVNKNQISCRQNTLYFIFSQGWIRLSKFFRCLIFFFFVIALIEAGLCYETVGDIFSMTICYKSIVNEHSVFDRIRFPYAKFPFLCDS